MERAYLLLRNNIQTGPFSLAELAQQSLQPSDFIWIEGESRAWSTPPGFTERPEQLRGQLEDSAVDAASGNIRGNIWVQMPYTSRPGSKPVFEERTQHSAAFTHDNIPSQPGTAANRKQQNAIDEIELIVHDKKSRPVNFMHLILAGGLIAFAILVWENSFTPIAKKERITYATKPVVFDSKSTQAVAGNEIVLTSNTVALTASDTSFAMKKDTLSALSDSIQNGINTKKIAKSKEVSNKVKKAKGTIAADRNKPPAVPAKTEISTEPTEKEEVLVTSNEPVNKSSEPVTAIQAEKKKTLGQAIRGLFKKKKKKEVKTEDASIQE